MKIRFLRHPKTTQEKRRNSFQEERDFVRKKRASANLPDAWNDIWIWDSRKKHVSWKKLRKTKYRNVPAL